MVIKYQERLKPDYSIIEDLIAPNSAVVDLGCGDGTLLETLIKNKNVHGTGIEIDPEGLNQCLKKGLSVLEQDLNKGLSGFQANSFDYAVLNITLQVMRNPLNLIKEMVRVGRKGIVGFPNFSYWKVIGELIFTHHMPKTKTLPFDWYETPNIRMITVRDFKDLCRENGIRILKEIYLNENGREITSFLSGCRAAESIFLLEKS
jgi:methionine biosynthesis protein MetW